MSRTSVTLRKTQTNLVDLEKKWIKSNKMLRIMSFSNRTGVLRGSVRAVAEKAVTNKHGRFFESSTWILLILPEWWNNRLQNICRLVWLVFSWWSVQKRFQIFQNDIFRLKKILWIPENISCATRAKIDDTEAFFIFLTRFAWPC